MEKRKQLDNFILNILLTILKNSNNKPINLQDVRDSIRITSESFDEIITRLQDKQLLPYKNEQKLSIEQRLGLAIMAIEAGADFQRVSNVLGWLEFEELVAHVFEMNGFEVNRRYRFNANGRRWEIDVLAKMHPYIICAECKHYTLGIGVSTVQKIIETHIEKTKVFSSYIEQFAIEIGVQRWRNVIITPIALTLYPTKIKFYKRVPSVSVFELPKYLSEFQGQLGIIACFQVELPKWKPNKVENESTLDKFLIKKK
jgi:hypothetical protein